MGKAIFFLDRPGGRNKRLPDYLTAVHSLPTLRWAKASENIFLYLFEVEEFKKIFEFSFHFDYLVFVRFWFKRSLLRDVNIIGLVFSHFRHDAPKSFNHITCYFFV